MEIKTTSDILRAIELFGENQVKFTFKDSNVFNSNSILIDEIGFVYHLNKIPFGCNENVIVLNVFLCHNNFLMDEKCKKSGFPDAPSCFKKGYLYLSPLWLVSHFGILFMCGDNEKYHEHEVIEG